MKVVLPAPEHPDSFAHNVAFTLRRMGHEVHSPPLGIGTPFPRLRRAASEIAAKSAIPFATAAERWAVRASRAFRPDMLLAVTQQLSQSTLEEIAALGVKYRVAWWGDAPANMQRLGLLTPGWDFIFLKDETAVEKLRRVDSNAFVLHEAMNPHWHRRVAQQANDAVVIVGSWYAYRQALTCRLLDAGIAIGAFGLRPPSWRLPGLERVHIGRYLTCEDKSRVFGEGLACLNSMDFAEGNTLNCRAFEIAGAGGLQLIEHRPAIEQCFEPGRELLTFSELDELLAHIERARRAPRDVESIRSAGERRAHAEHTYELRLAKMFRTIGV